MKRTSIPAVFAAHRAVPAQLRKTTILAASLEVAAGLLAIRLLWVVATLARVLPEGPWPVVRFGLVALVVNCAPGLALLRLFRVRLSLPETAVFVHVTSLAATGLVTWTLYFCGLYVRGAALATLALSAAAGAWGAAPLLSRRSRRALASRLLAVPSSAWIAPLLAAFLLEGIFETALGRPFVAWDAAVTWDKWATDAGARTGIGAQLLGGYPQLLPALHSIFYKAAATPAGAVLPAEQLMLHGFDVVFPTLLATALFALGHRFHFSALLAFGLLSACDPLFASLASGEADIPLTAFAAATAALLPPLTEQDGNRRGLAPLAILLFALVFVKGTGIVLAAALVGAVAARNRCAARRVALPALIVAIALAAPYFAHQLWLSAHPAAREPSPFLVALPLHTAHTRLFTPDLAHLGAMLRRLVAHRCAPSGAAGALAALGAGIAGALVRRQTRSAGLALLALLVFWFFTASYDWRNAFPALAFGAAVLAAASSPPTQASPTDPRNRRIGRLATIAPAALLLALSATAIAGATRSGARDAFLAPFAARWRAPKAACLPPEERHMALRPAGDLRTILATAPWAASAAHIWTGDPLYRLLAPRGCYAIQDNAWRDAKPGDLFVATAALPRPPAGFLEIAALNRTPGYRSLWMFRPELAPGLVLERLSSGEEVPPTRPLFGEAVANDPFAPYLAPIRDGDVLRLPNPSVP